MMRYSTYMLLLFSISLVLYYFGYGPVVNIFSEHDQPISIGCPEGDPYCTDQSTVIGAIFLVLLGAAALVALVTNFSAMYVIPILLLMATLNFFIFPLNFIYSAPDLLKVPLFTFFNVITVLAVLDFIRGGA